MPERICEQCHKSFRIEGEVCPDDGGRLLTIASADTMIGRVIENKLTLTGVLGQGGMGVVYRARQHSMDREVAVKVLHPGFSNDAEAVKRFLHEARAASRLDHPNVITVFDFGRTDDGLLYLVMELLVGHSLGSEVDQGALHYQRAMHILTQVADAVHHAHDRGLVHRDLKPENVYLVQGSSLRGDFVKVLDFGIATMRAHEGLERITRTGSVCGTPAYMSPEQVLGDEIDLRSDVYALGVIAFEMLTGQHPLPADTAMRQMLAHLEAPVPTFASLHADPSIPPGIEAAVRHAMEKKRDQRTPSALAFANELMAAVGQTTPYPPVAAARPPSSQEARAYAETGRAAPVERQKSRWPLAIVGLLLAGGAAAGIALATSSKPPEPEAVAVAEPTTKAPDPKPEPKVEPKPEPTKAPEPAVPTKAPEPPPETKPPEPKVEVPPEPPAPKLVKLTSLPDGAQVIVDGVPVGKTPFDIARPAAGEATKKVTLKLKGYHDSSVEVSAESEDVPLVKLKKRAVVTNSNNNAPIE